jgi:hypothetical protein
MASLAIANPNQPVKDACVAFTFMLFPLAASMAIASPHARRYFAIGFIVWGVGYLAFGLLKKWDWYYDDLLTTQWSEWLYGFFDRNSIFPQPIYSPDAAVPAYPDPFGGTDDPFGEPAGPPLPNSKWLIFRTTMPSQESFVAICECLWTIFFGFIGGWVTASIYRSRRTSTSANPS